MQIEMRDLARAGLWRSAAAAPILCCFAAGSGAVSRLRSVIVICAVIGNLSRCLMETERTARIFCLALRTDRAVVTDDLRAGFHVLGVAQNFPLAKDQRAHLEIRCFRSTQCAVAADPRSCDRYHLNLPRVLQEGPGSDTRAVHRVRGAIAAGNRRSGARCADSHLIPGTAEDDRTASAHKRERRR